MIRSFFVLSLMSVAGLVVAADPAPMNENKATPPSRIKAPPGFKVELLYSVPGDEQGSWVNLCTDPKGRIIVSDQYGGLYRFYPPAPGQTLDPAKVEKMPAQIRAANGLLWAFDALYVGVNDYERKIASGVYRITDSDGDDKLDKVELLRAIKSGGDHGVHAILPSPDGKSLFLISGNNADLTRVESVPESRCIGARIICSRGCRTDVDTIAIAWRRAGIFTSFLRTENNGNSTPPDSETFLMAPLIVKANCSPTTRTWNMTSTRRGIVPHASTM